MNPDSFHRHGGMPELDFRRLGLSARPVKDFSVNISPLGPPREILKAWDELVREVERYPTIEGEGVVCFYSKSLNLPKECVLAGNGSTELIYLVPRVLDLKRVAVVIPSFHDYTRASQIAGANVLPIKLRNRDFAPPGQEEFRRVLAQTDALFIGNPNNPTGTVFSRETLLLLSEEFSDKWFMVDEAFVEFLDEYHEVTLASSCLVRRKNILVFRSLTKFYSLPGLRIGCVLGHPEVIRTLAASREPWTVNRIAEKVAPMLVDCRDYDEKLRHLVKKERIRLRERANRIRGLRSFPCSANFFLCQWTLTDDLDDLLKSLLLEGLYVRDCRNFPGLKKNFFRFGIRTPDENDRLLSAIEKCVEACHD